ncbi:MAG: LAGLIDADG family homing endonuclease, partial [Gaiellaceae bacterium]
TTVIASVVRREQYGDNVTGADNQQERLDGYISGYVDGEGSFSVVVNRNPSCKTGYQLVPEFHVSQNGDRAQVLEIIRQRLGGCGYIKSNGRRDQAVVLVVRNRADLLDRVIPFFERSPLLSSKQRDFEKFACIVRAMGAGHHRSREGFQELLSLALSMNGNGRFRRVRWEDVIDGHPESSETGRRTKAKEALEETVRTARRRAESGRNDLALER